MAERHRATIGVFGIPVVNGKGLWSKRADGKGINAIGGAVDPADAADHRKLVDVLRREFLEEAGLEIEITDERPLGVFPTADLGDMAILFAVTIVSEKPTPSAEAVEHLWMTSDELAESARTYDAGDHANGLVSGVGKRQWQMAQAAFKHALLQ